MSIFNRLFNTKSKFGDEPQIRFGRYTDAYRAASKDALWEEAQAQFDKGNYLNCYRSFFSYLRDVTEDNVRCNDIPGGLSFELYQGSKKITGSATPYAVKAEAKIVKDKSFDAAIMRNLLEQNFSLRYSRYALDESGNITIVFDTPTVDGSPYKLYAALKEVATKADKQDDLLLEEFQNLELVEASHLESLPPGEKEVKYQYIQSSIQETLQEAESAENQSSEYARGIGFLLLDLIFRLDYLIKPEGFMMEILERIHRQYYENDGRTVAEKNKTLCEGLRSLLTRPKEDFFKEMYRIKSTFGITHIVNHDRVRTFIENELPAMDWYQKNGRDALSLSIPGYIVGYCMFNYAVPEPDRDLFHLYYLILESDFFKALGFKQYYYNAATNTFDKKGIKKAIAKIIELHEDKYDRLAANTGMLNFKNRVDFSRSFMYMTGQMRLVKTE